ncbi:hypothetical protein [Okeania sp. KiyG1]|nr:hypothetical protein [Okeania sp. KiyG1]
MSQIVSNIKSGSIGVIQYLKIREWHSPYIVGANGHSPLPIV